MSTTEPRWRQLQREAAARERAERRERDYSVRDMLNEVLAELEGGMVHTMTQREDEDFDIDDSERIGPRFRNQQFEQARGRWYPRRLRKHEKIGPRLPGGALTKGRTVETKIGACTVQRSVDRRPKHRSRGWYGTAVEFVVDCGAEGKAYAGAKTHPGSQKEWAKQYGLDPSRPIWFIGTVETEKKAQRKRLATRVYEALAQYVCSHGGQLVSDGRLSRAKSNDFWKKQIEKGRARIVGKPNGRKSRAFAAYAVALDCAHAGDLSGGLGQLTTRTSRVVLAAKQAGYRVDAKGRVIAPSGRVRKVQTKGSVHGPYRYRTFSMKDGEHVVAVPVAHLAAVQKYGKKALRAGTEVRHLNDRSTDDRPTNIAIGSRHTNIMDSPKAKRVRIAKAGAKAAKRARRKR